MDDGLNEKKRLILSLYFPFLLLLVLWGVKIIEVTFNLSLAEWGIYPREIYGLKGILTAPLIHGDFKHLYNNSIPLAFVTWLMVYLYKDVAYKTFFLIWIISGLWVWFGGRESYHIGASGIVYGIVSFVFFSGILRRDIGLMTISLLMVFLYGSMIWGILPFLPMPDISWESHLSGGVIGFILSVYFRHQGPQRKVYEWENEDEKENEDEIKELEEDDLKNSSSN